MSDAADADPCQCPLRAQEGAAGECADAGANDCVELVDECLDFMAELLERLSRRGFALWLDPEGRLMIRHERTMRGREDRHRRGKQRHARRAARREQEIEEQQGPPLQHPPLSPEVPVPQHQATPSPAQQQPPKTTSTLPPPMPGASNPHALFERAAARRRRHADAHHAADSAGVLGVFHGITYEDMPGRDDMTRRMNFMLFRRGRLRGYQSCAGLHGEELKAEFNRIHAPQRVKSLQARDQRLGRSSTTTPTLTTTTPAP